MTADRVQLQVEIDENVGLPAYEQIRLQVLAHLATGRLGSGDVVPGVRELAAQLGVASGSVQRAYRELERSGVLVTDGSARPHVSDVPASLPTSELRTAAVRLVAWARDAGLDDQQVLDVVRRALLGHLGAGEAPVPSVPRPRAPFEVGSSPLLG